MYMYKYKHISIQYQLMKRQAINFEGEWGGYAEGFGGLKEKRETLWVNYNLKNTKYKEKKNEGILFEMNKMVNSVQLELIILGELSQLCKYCMLCSFTFYTDT